MILRDIQAWHYSIFMIDTQNLKKTEFTYFIYLYILITHLRTGTTLIYHMVTHWSWKLRRERWTCVSPREDGESLEPRNMRYNINSCTRDILPVTYYSRLLRDQCGNLEWQCTSLVGSSLAFFLLLQYRFVTLLHNRNPILHYCYTCMLTFWHIITLLWIMNY